MLAVLSVGVTACGGSSKSSSTPSATAAADTTSISTTSASASNAANTGVVTIRMAIVGDPGNPSVGVIQSFGGPTGQFVDPPKPPKDTGIYKNCSDAPAAPPPCLTVGGIDYTYGIGENAVNRMPIRSVLAGAGGTLALTLAYATERRVRRGRPVQLDYDDSLVPDRLGVVDSLIPSRWWLRSAGGR